MECNVKAYIKDESVRLLKRITRKILKWVCRATDFYNTTIFTDAKTCFIEGFINFRFNENSAN